MSRARGLRDEDRGERRGKAAGKRKRPVLLVLLSVGLVGGLLLVAVCAGVLIARPYLPDFTSDLSGDKANARWLGHTLPEMQAELGPGRPATEADAARLFIKEHDPRRPVDERVTADGVVASGKGTGVQRWHKWVTWNACLMAGFTPTLGGKEKLTVLAYRGPKDETFIATGGLQPGEADLPNDPGKFEGRRPAGLP
jgi:hypothetical protein